MVALLSGFGDCSVDVAVGPVDNLGFGVFFSFSFSLSIFGFSMLSLSLFSLLFVSFSLISLSFS